MLKERALAFVEFPSQEFTEFFLGSDIEDLSDEEIEDLMLKENFEGSVKDYRFNLEADYIDFIAEFNAVINAVQVVIASLIESPIFEKLVYNLSTGTPFPAARSICRELAKEGKPDFVYEWMGTRYDSLSLEQKQFADEMEVAIGDLIWTMYVGRYLPIAAGSDLKFMLYQVALMYNKFFSDVYLSCYDLYLPSSLNEVASPTFIDVSDLLLVMPPKYKKYFLNRAPNPNVLQ